MKMPWIDLSGYGIELKRLELSNESAFPVAIISDLEKYKQSGAVSLDSLKGDHESNFKKLPGDKKGRGFNTPILFLTNKYSENGSSNYNIINSLSKLLNISQEEVSQLRTEMDKEKVILKDAFYDVDKFTSAVQDCTQQYFGSLLYAVKEKRPTTSLQELAAELSNKQHDLFIKASFENLPLETLDDFNFNSSIVEKVFLNPNDAKKNGFELKDLEVINLNGETSVLPLSLNKDLSLNVITNVAATTQLAFSNYNWKKNLSLIDDYNALISLRETSRHILNARPSVISSKEDMENHLESLSTSLQNYREVNGYSRANSAIKFNKKDAEVYVLKNNEGEWRYIEKNYNKKTDLPLTWENYQKAISVIADNNTTLSAALVEKVKTGAEFDDAMLKVFKAHQTIFKKFIKTVENEIDKNEQFINININGNKVHANFIKSKESNFDRDLGQNLYDESVKRLLGGMLNTEVNDISDLVGGEHVDSLSLEAGIKKVQQSEISEDPVVDDIGLSFLDNHDLKSLTTSEKTLIDTPTYSHSTNSVEKYDVLPKGISDSTDANYDELNSIYQTLQYFELSANPWLNHLKEELESSKKSIAADIGEDFSSSVETFVKVGVLEEKDYKKSLETLKSVENLTNFLDEMIQKNQIKANILKYQFGKHIKDADLKPFGLLAFNSENGAYKPFETKSDYEQSVNLLKNRYFKENLESDSLQQFESEVKSKLDMFVDNHYYSAKNPQNDFDLKKSIENIIPIYKFEEQSPTYINLPVLNERKVKIGQELLSLIRDGVGHFVGTKKSIELDTALIHVASFTAQISHQTGIENPFKLNPEFNSILKTYAQINRDDLSSYGSPAVYNEKMAVPASSTTKLDILKNLYNQGLDLAIEDESILRLNQINTKTVFNEAYLQANKSLEQDPIAYQQELAGRYLIVNQGFYEPDFENKDRNYAFGLNTNHGMFIVEKFSPDSQPAGLISLNAVSYQDAVKEGFVNYNIRNVASDIGLTSSDLDKLIMLSKSIKNNDSTASEQISKLFNLPLEVKDLSTLTSYKTSNLDEGVIVINGKEHPIDNNFNRINNSLGLLSSLSSIQNNLQISPIIKNFENLNGFDAVRDYLQVDVQEKIHISSEELSYPLTNFDKNKLSNLMADYAVSSFRNKPDSLKMDNGNLTITTSIPMNIDTPIFTRIVDSDWVSRINVQTKVNNNFNCSYLPLNDISSASISNQVLNNMTEISSHSSQPSLPVHKESYVHEPMFRSKSKEIEGILHKGDAFKVFNSQIFGNAEFLAQYATANFENALVNMPRDLKDNLKDYLVDSKADLLPIRLSLSSQKDLNLPELRIDTPYSALPPGNTVVLTTSMSNFVRNVVTTSGFKIDSEGKIGLNISNSDNLINAHNKFLGLTNFDLEEYKQNVKSLTTNEFGSHYNFVQKFDSTLVKNYTDVIDKYVEIIKDDINSLNPKSDKVYLHIGNEDFLPQVYISATKASDYIVDLTGNLQELDATINKTLVQAALKNNLLPLNYLVDSVKAVKIESEKINADSILLARQNFITQVGDKLREANYLSNSTEIVDSSKVFIKNTGSEVYLAIAASNDQAQHLAKESFKAVISSPQEKDANIFKLVSSISNDHLRKNLNQDLLVESINEMRANAAFVEYEASPVVDTTYMATELPLKVDTSLYIGLLEAFQSVDAAQEQIMEQKDIDLLENQVVRVPTEFVEKLDKDTISNISKLSVSELSKNIRKDNLWSNIHPNEHINSGHQTLDTILITQTFKALLDKWPHARENKSINDEANIYSAFISNMYDAVAQSHTPSEFLSNFDKAYMRIAALDPTYLRDGTNNQNTLLSTLKKASYLHIKEGVDIQEALAPLAQHDSFKRKFSDLALEVAKNEVLKEGEKSFIHYFDGFTLSDKNNLDTTNKALASRLGGHRIPSDFDFTTLKTSSPNVRENVLLEIDSINKSDFKADDVVINLKDKWGVNVIIPEEEKMFGQGYAVAIDNYFQKLNSKIGCDSKFTEGLRVVVGHRHNHHDAGAIFFADLTENPDKIYTNLTSQIIGLTMSNIEKEEKKHMTPQELNSLETARESYGGLVQLIANHGYKPKTKEGKILADLHTKIKEGMDAENTNNPYEQFIKNSDLLAEKQSAELYRKGQNHSDDYYVQFINYITSNLSSRQEIGFKQIEEKLSKLASKNNQEPDLYAFTSIDKMFEKVSNVSFVAPDSVINKFVETKYPGKDKNYKAEVFDEIKANIANNDYLVNAAKDYLHARAENKLLHLLDAYAPESIKGTDKFIDSVRKDFGNILDVPAIEGYKADGYKSKFGAEFEQKSILMYFKTQDYTDDSITQPFSPDEVVCAFLTNSITDSEYRDKDIYVPLTEAESKLAVAIIPEITTILEDNSDVANTQERTLDKNLVKEDQQLEI